jgi:hypothetical protein
MFNVALIKMLLANLNMSSIGLTQLLSELKIGTEIFHLKHAFAKLFGSDASRRSPARSTG